MTSIHFLTFVVYFCAANNIYLMVNCFMGKNRSIESLGIVYDVIYGMLGSLNLITDAVMVAALLNRNESGMKGKLRVFLLWNGVSAFAGFVTDIFFSSFFSEYAPLDKAELNDIPEGSARTTLYYICIVAFTSGFAVKGIVLAALCLLYVSYDDIVAERVQDAERASAEREGSPGGYRHRTQPAAADRTASPSAILSSTPEKVHFGPRPQSPSFQEQRYLAQPRLGPQSPPVEMPYHYRGAVPPRLRSATDQAAGAGEAAVYQPAQAASQLSYTPRLSAPRFASSAGSAAPLRAASTPESLSSPDASPETTTLNQAASAPAKVQAPKDAEKS